MSQRDISGSDPHLIAANLPKVEQIGREIRRTTINITGQRALSTDGVYTAKNRHITASPEYFRMTNLMFLIGKFHRQHCSSSSSSFPHILLLLLLSRFSHVRLCATPETAAHQAPRPWDSPGKNTGVGCHFLLQCMKVKSESEVAQSCPTPSDPMDCSLPGSSVHGIFQARVLEWGVIAFSDYSL